MRADLAEMRNRDSSKGGGSRFRSLLAVRQQFSPVDIYSYLKARFGEPNGVQNILRKDDSDNWIHWDFNLKVDGEDVYISGTYREIHFMLSEQLDDEDWPVPIQKIKANFGRVGKEKQEILRSFEKWAVFPNKFVEISNVCAELHGEIVKDMKLLESGGFPRFTSRAMEKEQIKYRQKLATRMFDLYRNCLELSLITPVLAEGIH